MQPRDLALPIGALLILAVLALEGLAAFPRLVEHVVEDFTTDLGIHAFIAGWLLLMYAAIRMLRSRKGLPSRKR